MEHDKWIRKLVAILVEMGFEPQAPQAHRKFVYRGDKCKHEVNLVIQSHAKESSKKAIVSYVKRTLREAGADMEMISKLDNLAFGFIADGLSIDEIDDALFAALKTNETELAAEIGIELGKAIIEQGADSYNIKAFGQFADYNNQSLLARKAFNNIKHMLSDLFLAAFKEHINRYGYFELYKSSLYGGTSQFDHDICEKYSLKISGQSVDTDELILSGSFTDEIKNLLTSHNLHPSFDAVFNNNTGDDNACFTDEDDYSTLRMAYNPNMSLEQANQLETEIEHQRLINYLG